MMYYSELSDGELRPVHESIRALIARAAIELIEELAIRIIAPGDSE